MKKIMFLKTLFSKFERKSQADSNSWAAVHMPDTLTTELWWYLTKSINRNNSTNVQIAILWINVFKTVSRSVFGYLKTRRQKTSVSSGGWHVKEKNPTFEHFLRISCLVFFPNYCIILYPCKFFLNKLLAYYFKTTRKKCCRSQYCQI